MKKSAIALLLLLLMPFAAQAQTVNEVTVKQILTAAPDSLQKAINNQATLSTTNLERLLASPYLNQNVRFTGVILTDVYNSGNASPANGIPGRIHVFLRDTSAVQNGTVMPGYTIQVVDGNWQTNGWQNYAPGNVVTVTGSVTAFSGVLQVAPTTVTLEEDNYADIGLPAAIMEPIAVSLGDLYVQGDPDAASNISTQSKLNLANWNLYNQEYVKLTGLTIDNSNEWTAGRFNIAFVNKATGRAIEFQDISVRYRNDRVGTDYVTAGFNVRPAGDPFIVPAIGSRVNVSGFLLYNRNDGFGYFNPNPNLRVVPMADSDLEVLPGAPPSVTPASRPAALVTGTTDLVITSGAEAGQGRSLAKVELFVMVDNGAPLVYPMTNTSGTGYSATIPASILNDGNFVRYYVRVTDNENETTDSDTETIRVLTKVDDLSDIQTTADGGLGASPLTGITFDSASGLMDLVVTIQTDADSTNIFSAQDGTDPWSGIFLRSSNDLRALEAGAQIRITGALVSEFRDATQLENLTFEVVSATGTPYPYKEVTTAMIADPMVAEAHEGMMLRFNNVEITSTNPDAPSGPFGEWAFRTVGTTAELRADDASNNIPSTFAASLAIGAKYDYIQGVLSYSFGNFKLLPQYLSDLAIATALGDGALPEGFGLGRTYPNPARTAAAIPFSLGQAGFVTLDVYDALGRRVARVLAEDRPAGAQEARFSTEALGAGLYLVRLTAGGEWQTQPLVVVR